MKRFPFPSQYEQGGVYEIPLMLRNADPAGLTRRVRVLPPASPYFSVSLVSYPSTTGSLAAGMHAEVRPSYDIAITNFVC